MSAERTRLTLALLLSMLIHTLLLSLTFGDQLLGLPGFAFPWRERRIKAPDLRVTLVPARAAAAAQASASTKEPPQQASVEQTVSVASAPIPSAPSATVPGLTAVAIVPEAKTTATVEQEPATATGAAPSVVPAKMPSRIEGPIDAASAPIPVPEVIAVDQTDKATWAVPPPQPAPTPVIAVSPRAPIAPDPETVIPAPRNAGEVAQKPAEPDVQREAAPLAAARQEAARVEAAKLEGARLEAQQQEAARLVAAQVEAQRQDVIRQEAAHIEAARLEAVQLDTRRREAARLAATQLEAQRQQVARQEAARVEVARLQAARLETDRQEAVRQASAQKEAARVLAEKEEDARRAARREAMGRQLNEEAARREATATAARSPSTLPYSLSTARRFRLMGRSDPNVELVEYAEGWARKIQLNTPVDMVREVAKRPHTNPMVTVAIRSDGSVESVTFALSSGVAEVDEAIRRIVQSLVPYQAFPPGLAREYDVIEVRRTWHFDTAIRLH